MSLESRRCGESAAKYFESALLREHNSKEWSSSGKRKSNKRALLVRQIGILQYAVLGEERLAIVTELAATTLKPFSALLGILLIGHVKTKLG